LGQSGLDLWVFPITNPQEGIVQERVRQVRAPVQYLEAFRRQPRSSRAAQREHVFSLSPVRYLQTLLYVTRNKHLDAGYRNSTRFECFEMAIYLAWKIEEARQKTGKRMNRLHAHFAHDPALIALLTHMLLGIPFSFTAHARDLYQLAVSALEERARHAFAVVTCCGANRDYMGQVLPEALSTKVHLIHHGVDVQSFYPAPDTLPVPDAPLILSVGRLIEKKGFPALLDAFKMLKDSGQHFKGEIYGDGLLYDHLAMTIQQNELQAHVILGGAKQQDELVPLFQKAAVFALTPSVTNDGDRDGIPNVLVEAMACGIPIISTAVAGIPELVTHGLNGLLYEPEDVKGIASGLSDLLKDENRRKRMGQAARQTVLDRFDLKVSGHRMANLLLQMEAVGGG